MENLKLSYQSIFLITVTCCFTFHGSSAQTDTINSTFTLGDPDAIVSPGNVFKLGFFSPQNTTSRYLAIFYVVSEQTTVWVANRDNPLTDSSGRVAISREGNLVLTDSQNRTIWSTNLTTPTNATTARLLDNGNFVLYDDSTPGNSTWDSFSHPTDSWIPQMRVIDDTITGQKLLATSWNNASNPGTGGFTLGILALEIPQVFTWKSDGAPHFRSGQFNGQIFIGMRAMYSSAYTNRIAVQQLSPGVVYFVIPNETFLSRFSLNSSGTVEKKLWNDQRKSWDLSWAVPWTTCDVYNTCGPFASCNSLGSPICSCLKGFEPADREEWDRGNWTRGCVRRTQLQCSRSNNPDGDDFLRMPFMKVPDFAEPFPSSQIEDCRVRCLRNCSCIAYAHDTNNIGCMFWRERDGLIDMQQFPNVGYDLYVRLAKSELDKHKDRKLLIILLVVGAVVALSLILFFIAWCCVVKKKEGRVKHKNPYAGKAEFSSDSSSATFLKDESSKDNIEDLPLFSFETLSNAANGFSDENMLGKGGFGVVYKGTLSNGKEIAVKRLSEASKQGTQEFTNEVVVISKLQHRNLVRLMGCCAERQEKMLIYEYMPNKSLDVYLFDPSLQSENPLDWKKRYNIIEGIGRGLLYLHRDSRLRIIHRDLKPSNVLLDQDWEPKISDFGMARIFESNQDQANTARVVGTYGYMAPEYAVEGRFSEKSDVYSFGVLVLEIVSGKKNTQYYNHEWSLSLLGFAWKLWSEGNGMNFADQNIANPNVEQEIVRCIHIALLCVQESAYDRPTIQTVLSMLSCEIVDLPFPQQPVFAEKWNRFGVSSSEPVGYSINQLSVTELDGR